MCAPAIQSEGHTRSGKALNEKITRNIKRDDFKRFAEKLRGFGFQVYLNKDAKSGNYAVYTDRTNVVKL